jgi:putative hemolysin
MATEIILIVIFITLSALFSSSEAALFSLDRSKLSQMHARYSSKRTKQVKFLLSRPSLLLALLIFSNNLVNVGIAAISTTVFVNLFQEKGALISILVTGTVILIIGEILPKTIAIYSAVPLSNIVAPVLSLFYRIFYPIILVLQKISDSVSSRLLRHKKGITSFSEEELKTALSLGRKDGFITEAEKNMVSYILKFKDTLASQIMTPRVEVEAIDVESSQQKVLNTLKEKKHSKFPVFSESMDNVKGVLRSKDVFFYADKDWHDFIREPLFVPESKKIDDLLEIFIKQHKHIAIILDEYGGTAGIVTLEDIIEEIFGELYDEYEFPQQLIKKIGKDTYQVFARTPIKNINVELGVELPEDEDTIAGLILLHSEKIPQPQERIVIKNVEFIVQRASRRKLTSLIARKIK